MVVVPRRTPWSTTEELHQVFGWLFAADGDVAVQRYAIQRIQVWMVRGNCPHAIESTSSLLELILLDTTSTAAGSSHPTRFQKPSQQELRLGYSMAMIRFVNSLVDPLQTTYFARSMTSLAAQLGLPLWFVELRHAATHEDLPGLSVLRDAARQALDWLYTNYWLPLLAPSATTTSVTAINSNPSSILRPLLTTYKSLMKTALRDASQASKIRPELAQTYRGIEGWIAQQQEGEKARALEGMVECLLDTGMLVPEAKKKRVSARSPEISLELAAIWTPLLNRLDDLFEGLQESLLMRMVDLLGANGDQTTSDTNAIPDKSYFLTLSAWIVHLLRSAEDVQLTETMVKNCLVNPNPLTLTLVDNLSAADEELAKVVKPLVNVMRNNNTGFPVVIEPDQADSMLAEMERRMMELEKTLSTSAAAKANASSLGTQGLSREPKVNGWPLAQNWKPCPIGSLPGKIGVPVLDLPARR